MKRPRGPRWEDHEGVEERAPVKFSGAFSEMGRSGGYAQCPFCKNPVRVYWWSLAGSGKRCPCGALIGQIGAVHWKER